MAKIFFGTEVKLNIHIEPMDGMSMSEYDFDIELICGSFKKQSIVINKKDAKKVDDDNYKVCFDTTGLGVGNLICRVTAYIPDGDFKDGKRTEVTETSTGIEIVMML
jgi:hypothetical protein